ncbi:hypothetical protein [Legionella maioricensis]|uniref:Uncharacterized protein n=1 Tax=Legionella maioricensis TaxID=2896528 RepID=A0A9X2D231_9GAMM|nr:hypothetical protein [Legionella maioricensis]MCL9685061.1 hypothetical protein [Legionella maioricensis]MCL9688178.1 hypothetical protein [Legionella maioricensis]
MDTIFVPFYINSTCLYEAALIIFFTYLLLLCITELMTYFCRLFLKKKELSFTPNTIIVFLTALGLYFMKPFIFSG